MGSHNVNHGFHGRDAELRWLCEQFDLVSHRGNDGKYPGPRMAMLIAESGLGKSRLVRELYLKLAQDPKWNPAGTAYWPREFGGDERQMRESPDLNCHVPEGPPNFMWLGIRWQPPGQRNADVHSRLTVLNGEIAVHMRLVAKNRSVWHKLLESKKSKLIEMGIEIAAGTGADLLCPFGSAYLKLLSDAGKSLHEHHFGPSDSDGVADDQAKKTADDMLDHMRGLLSGAQAIPTVLFLDDAQFGKDDRHTLEFVGRLWEQAKRGRWPLLVVCAHWEQEWNELTQQLHDRAGWSFAKVAKSERFELKTLGPATTDDLNALLLERFPGLSTGDCQLLLEKAASNFAAMMENMNDLESDPFWFVDRRLDQPLSEDGLNEVRGWSDERHERKQQRFKKLTESRRNILGWSSRLGSRFMASVVAQFAEQVAEGEVLDLQLDANREIAWCVDPGIFLSESGGPFREFRDKVYHEISMKRYDKILRRHHEDRLVAVFHDVLVTTVDAAYESIGAAQQSGEIPAAIDETATVSLMATRELAPALDGDWGNATAEAKTWLRAVCLMVIDAANARQWDRVVYGEQQLCRVELEKVPLDLMSQQVRDRLVLAFAAANALKGEIALRSDAARRSGEAMKSKTSEDDRYRCAKDRADLGLCHFASGDVDEASSWCRSALKICEKYTKEYPIPARWADVAIDCVTTLARCAYLCGNSAEARAWGRSTLSIAGYTSKRDKHDSSSATSMLRIATALGEASWYALASGDHVDAAEYARKADRQLSRLLSDKRAPDLGRLQANLTMRRGMIQLGVAEVPLMYDLATPANKMHLHADMPTRDVSGARDSFERALTIHLRNLENDASAELRFEYRNCLDWNGFAASLAGDPIAAKYYTRAIAESCDLHEQCGNLRSLRTAVESRLAMANYLTTHERYTEAREHLDAAHALASELPENLMNARDFIRKLALMIVECKAMGASQNADESLVALRSGIGEIQAWLGGKINSGATLPGGAFRGLLEAAGVIVARLAATPSPSGSGAEVWQMWKETTEAGRNWLVREHRFPDGFETSERALSETKYNLYCAAVAAEIGDLEYGKELIEDVLFTDMRYRDSMWSGGRGDVEIATLIKVASGVHSTQEHTGRTNDALRVGYLDPDNLTSLVDELSEHVFEEGIGQAPAAEATCLEYAAVLEAVAHRELLSAGVEAPDFESLVRDVSRFGAFPRDKYWGHKMKSALETCRDAYGVLEGAVGDPDNTEAAIFVRGRIDTCNAYLRLLEQHLGNH